MAATVSPARVPTPGQFLGEFKIERFDVSHKEDRNRYQDLRTKSNKTGSGITIEHIRDQNEVTEVGQGEDRVRTERWYIVVSWWEREPKERTDAPTPEQGFYEERKSTE